MERVYTQEEARELEAELTRIKQGIKRGDSGLIIDGNDMTDLGWITHESVNKRAAAECSKAKQK